MTANTVTQSHRANAHGFIPDRPFHPTKTAVALVGDSLVEESMLPVEQRLASLLEDFRGGASVFSMGFGGSSLFDYLERIRYARDNIGLTTFWIIVERADIRESACEGGSYYDACIDADGAIIRPEHCRRNAVRDVLARSALLQYFVGVLRLSPGRFLAIFRTSRTADDSARNSPPRVVASPMESAVVERFLHEVQQLSADRVGLVLDPEISDLARGEPFGDPALALLYRRASEMGIPVVHPRRALAEYSKATGLDMRVGPYDAHWNVRANCVIAQEILDTLPGGRDIPRTPGHVCAKFGQSRPSTAAVSSMVARHMSGSE